MKTLIRIIVLIAMLILLPKLLKAQIDYHFDQINEISNKDSIVTIDYIISSPKREQLPLSLIVFFVNKNGDNLIGSYVNVRLLHNNKLVDKYTLNAADHIRSNYIILDHANAINLKKGDKVSLEFTLLLKTKNDKFDFMIKSVNETDNETQKKVEKYALTANTKPMIEKKEIKTKSWDSNKPSPELKKQRRLNTIAAIINGIR
jgi:hypothetical protein